MDDILVFRTGVLGTWREKYAGIAAFARTADWRLQPVDARSVRPDVRRLLSFWKPRGAIVDASGAPDRLRAADFGGLPFVVMTPGADLPGRRGIPSVKSDSEEIARLALGEILAGNPASILFVDWFEPREWAAVKRERARGIAALHGLPFAIVSPAPADARDPSRLDLRIAAAVAALPRPCGVFAVTDAVGAVALSALGRLGLDIPGDAAVVAVDDDPEVCENCVPTLTSVRPDFHRLGFAAGALLRERIGGAAPRSVVVPPAGVVRRASTHALRRPDRKVAEAVERIRLRACEGVRPAEIAAILGGTRRSAELRFKAATGRTIGAEILERRLAAACDLLKAGRNSVAAVAGFCGWNGDVAFRKAFKSRFGVPPLRWARGGQRAATARPARRDGPCAR